MGASLLVPASPSASSQWWLSPYARVHSSPVLQRLCRRALEPRTGQRFDVILRRGFLHRVMSTYRSRFVVVQSVTDTAL